MTTFKTQMENAKFGKDTLELMGIAGTLHDLIEQYIARYERLYPNLCEGGSIPDFEHQKVCEAFEPAITYIENAVIERVMDFMGSTGETEI